MGNGGDARIGVYVCHCGTNIAKAADVDGISSFASVLPHVVVSRGHEYLCSEAGQGLIQDDIKSFGINRVVVASCSPLLHEQTFRKALDTAGLNPFCLQMVNIREQASWVHTDGLAVTEKMRDLIRAAVLRVAYHREIEKKRVPVNPDVLVLGAGISGIHAALTLANAGRKVYLVEREPAIGGHMAMFDKTFPTMDCAACVLMPKMAAVRVHPNITLWTYSEVVKVSGHAGSYRVSVKRRPRHVKEDLCVGCQACIDACVCNETEVVDEFNQGLSKRKPVYIPYAQATPLLATIDEGTCMRLKTGECVAACAEACSRKAIDFDQKEEIIEIDVGSAILATGFKTFDAGRVSYYGYGAYPNVYTSLEVERLVNPSGPTGGRVILRDGRTPEAVGIIHCVGSRDENTNQWCSGVCCMYSLKLAHLIREQTGAEVYNFYIDIRASGKAMEELYNKVSEEGTNFIRGRVADVYPEPEGAGGKLIIKAEDTLISHIRKIPVDMVVLSVGLEPRADARQISRLFNIPCSSDGFFLEKHPKLAPVSTFVEGIFLAGCCQGPKDIADSVAQAGAAASEALAFTSRAYLEIEPLAVHINDDLCSGCQLCVGACPYDAITYDSEEKIVELNEELCGGCGSCVPACPSKAIGQHLFEDEQVSHELEGVLSHV